MATGGIFTIITNDGKQDRMLMATALLHSRLDKINKSNLMQKGGSLDDVKNLPTLLDIERTHVLFTNAHFKPFAAMGFEYNKVSTGSGNPSLGQTVQFSIPQFGDFFHDITCHVVLQQPTLNVSNGTATSDEPVMRWAHFPGERLLKRVSQEVNGNPLESYTYHAANMHREFRVAPNKLTGWKRNVGQELPEKGWLRQPDWALSNVASTGVTHRVLAEVTRGNQTPTTQKTAALEMFIPLLFWYNKDVRLAVPSVAIPFGQRFINLELATLDELVGLSPRGAGTFTAPNGTLTTPTATLSTIELYINNIFVNPEVHKIYIRRIGFSLIRVHLQQLYNANTSSATVHLQGLKWPIEYMYVGMKVKDYHLGSTSALKRQHLDKWHTFHSRATGSFQTTGQVVSQESALTELSTTTLGVATATGLLLGTSTLAQVLAVGDVIRIGGNKFTVVAGAAAAAAVTGVEVYPRPAADIAATAANAADSAVVSQQGLEYQTEQCTPTLDTINIKVHGIDLYKLFPLGFFNSYTPYHFGGSNVRTPEDCGLAFIPFCLFPGTYQPSGHINISRAREFYLDYTSSVIDSNTEGTLVVVASAINFLLISDGSAVLRYST